jgi:hypothetical protein
MSGGIVDARTSMMDRAFGLGSGAQPFRESECSAEPVNRFVPL